MKRRRHKKPGKFGTRGYRAAIYYHSEGHGQPMTSEKDADKTDSALRKLALEEARLNDIVGRDGMRAEDFLDSLEIGYVDWNGRVIRENIAVRSDIKEGLPEFGSPKLIYLEARRKILDNMRRRGPYTHNIVSIVLRSVRDRAGLEYANRLVKELRLDKKLNIQQVHENPITVPTFDIPTPQEAYADVKKKGLLHYVGQGAREARQLLLGTEGKGLAHYAKRGYQEGRAAMTGRESNPRIEWGEWIGTYRSCQIFMLSIGRSPRPVYNVYDPRSGKPVLLNSHELDEVISAINEYESQPSHAEDGEHLFTQRSRKRNIAASVIPEYPTSTADPDSSEEEQDDLCRYCSCRPCECNQGEEQ